MSVATYLAKRGEGETLLADVCATHGVWIDDVLSPSRERRFVVVRREVVMRLRGLGWAVTEIGYLLRRNHSAVIQLSRSEEARAAFLLEKKVRAGMRAA